MTPINSTWSPQLVEPATSCDTCTARIEQGSIIWLVDDDQFFGVFCSCSCAERKIENLTGEAHRANCSCEDH